MNVFRCRAIAHSSRVLYTARPFSSSSIQSRETQNSPGDTHTTQKPHTLDPQAENAKKGMKAKADANDPSSKDAGVQDNATGTKDTQGHTQRTKQEFPEAPDTVIGMQDERGKRE